jgi:hypothetical protein
MAQMSPDRMEKWRSVWFHPDSIYWYIRVVEISLLTFRHDFLAGHYPDLASRRCRGWQGYEFGIVVAPDLKVLVAPERHLAMGLRVQAGARWLTEHLPREWESSIRALVESWGIEVQRMVLSRVDLTLDVLSRNGFPQLDVARDFVSKARTRKAYTPLGSADGVPGRYTGYAIGKSDVRIRIYDKIEEATQDGDLEFWEQQWASRPE